MNYYYYLLLLIISSPSAQDYYNNIILRYVSLTATCQGTCFVHPVPTSTIPPKTSAGTKAVTTQGKTSSEHKSNTLSGKVTIDHVSIVDFKICRRTISILCSFASLKIGHLVYVCVLLKYYRQIGSLVSFCFSNNLN